VPVVTSAKSSAKASAERASGGPWAWCREFESLEGLRAAMRLAEAPLISTSATGACRCVVALADLGGARIAGTRLGGSAFTAGVTSADELSATVVLEADGGSINSVPLAPGTLFVFAPGTLYRGWNSAGYRWLTVSITRADAEVLAREYRWRVPDLRGGGMLSSRGPPEGIRSIRALARVIDLWRPRARPEPLDPGVLRPYGALWGTVLARAWARGVPQDAARRRVAGDAAVRRVIAYMEAHLTERLTSATLCRAARAPERTLEHLFRLRLGIPPTRYVAVLRLRAVRRALRLAAPGRDTTVAAIARAAGVRHLGRFSGAYLRMFGESPTDTLTATRAAVAVGEAAIDVLDEMAWDERTASRTPAAIHDPQRSR
jgi:AraC-like DNA-binding protein